MKNQTDSSSPAPEAHSPAPWRAVKAVDGEGYPCLRIATKDDTEFTAVAWLYAYGIESNRDAIRDANGRLIEAAPQLLAALKTLYGVARTVQDEGGGREMHYQSPELKQALRVARRALAAAKNPQPLSLWKP